MRLKVDTFWTLVDYMDYNNSEEAPLAECRNRCVQHATFASSSKCVLVLLDIPNGLASVMRQLSRHIACTMSLSTWEH